MFYVYVHVYILLDFKDLDSDRKFWYGNEYQVKNGQQGLVGLQWCLHDRCVNLQSKLTHCTLCFKLLFISQSDLLCITCTGICCQSYLFVSIDHFFILFLFIKRSPSKMSCWQYCITNAPFSICLSLSFSLSWNSSREYCSAYIFLSRSLSLSHIAGFPYPSLSVSALVFLLPLFSPWAQVL